MLRNSAELVALERFGICETAAAGSGHPMRGSDRSALGATAGSAKLECVPRLRRVALASTADFLEMGEGLGYL